MTKKRKGGKHPLAGRPRSAASMRKFKATMAARRAAREAARSASTSADGAPLAAKSSTISKVPELKGPKGVAARASASRRAVLLSLLANVNDEFSKSDITSQPGARKLSLFMQNRAFSDAVRDGTIRRLSKGRYRKGAVTPSTSPTPPINGAEVGHVGEVDDADNDGLFKKVQKELKDARANIRARLTSGRLAEEDRAHHLTGLAHLELQLKGVAGIPDARKFLALAKRAVSEDLNAGRLHEEDAAHTLAKCSLIRLDRQI